jgi:hypothetical protein
MKQNTLSQYGNKSWPGLLCATVLTAMLVLSLFVRASTQLAIASTTPTPALTSQVAPARPWTALGSTGAVDENSLSVYAVSTTEIGFKPGGTARVVVARYNVTNTFDNNASPNKPGWRTLEMGSNAPLNTIIDATLLQVKSCSPEPVVLCKVRNRSNDQPCAKCDISGTIEFTDNLYYVEVTLSRPSASTALPRMFTLRIF